MSLIRSIILLLAICAAALLSAQVHAWSDKEGKREWWSFQPITRPPLPAVRSNSRVRTPIDRFVLSELEQRGLTFSEDASQRVLVRRLYFDLLGVPPEVVEVNEYLADDRSDAYDRLVDRLLASPLYGEKWARHWLDTARYADSNGGGFDYVYPEAWRYRDYVVRAFNEDKSFKRFVLEQLAGDLLAVPHDVDSYKDQLVATGLLTLAPKGLGMQDKKLMELDLIDDQIDVVGRTLMATTLACARCHDHKFDPISTADYYRLAGIFHSTVLLSSTDKNPSYWPESPLEHPSEAAERQSLSKSISDLAKRLTELESRAAAGLAKQAKQKIREYLVAAVLQRIWSESHSLVAHWTMDDPSGPKIRSSETVHQPAGSFANVLGKEALPARVPGIMGQALRFSGQGDVVSFDKTKLGFLEFSRSSDFSISFWIRLPRGYVPTTADTVLSAKYGTSMWFVALRPGAFNGIYLRHYDGKRAVDIKPASDELPRLTDHAWHHLVFSSDRDGVGKVFIDGEPVGDQSIASISSAADFASPSKFEIGPSTNGFRGEIDDLAIFGTVLTRDEAQAIYKGASSPARQRNVAELRPSLSEDIGDPQPFIQRHALVRRFVINVANLTRKSDHVAHRIWMKLSDSSNRKPEALLKWVAALDEAAIVELAGKGNLFDCGESPLSDAIIALISADLRENIMRCRSEHASLTASAPPKSPVAMIARDASNPTDLPIHIAGDPTRLGSIVKRGVPDLFVNDQIDRGQISDESSGRLELATWLTDKKHPLTARVIVNRIWQWHFGQGLVRSADNFGRLGEKPSHPKLLDWLARSLIESDWSIKELHRTIVTSTTYRQSSRSNSSLRSKAESVDSGNRFLWRMNRRRLEAEAIRDSILAVSGRLDRALGGSVNQWKGKMFTVDDKNAETANYKTNRRSIYLPVIRDSVHDSLRLFDFGDPNSVAAQRNSTTVAPQALYLLNSKFVVTSASAFAHRVQNCGLDDRDDQIRIAYELAFSRLPRPTEMVRAQRFLGKTPQTDIWQVFCHSLLSFNEFVYVD